MLIYNTEYEILNQHNEFVDFKGLIKSTKDKGLKITLEDGKSIIVSEDHIFFVGEKDVYASSLIEYKTFISTVDGDKVVTKIEHVEGGDFYDIFESENFEYVANGISNHNCAFLGSGDNFIAGEYLGKIEEKQVQTPIRQEYVDSNMWIWEDPIPSEEYIMSIDVSSGHGDDYSTINMLKLSEFIENVIVTKNGIKTKQKVKKYKIEQVAEYYGKVSPQTLGEIGYIYGSKYNNAYTVIDITSGHGGQTVGKLFEMGYTNIHYCEIAHKPSRDMLNGYIKKGKKTLSDGSIVYVDLVPGFFIGSVRASVLIEFQRSIHMGDLIIRSKRTSEELKTFITVGGSRIADHGRSFHDDSIMGMAIGIYTINFDMKKYKINDDSTKDMINTMLNLNNNEKPKSKDERPSLFDRGFNNPYGANAWLFKGLK